MRRSNTRACGLRIKRISEGVNEGVSEGVNVGKPFQRKDRDDKFDNFEGFNTAT